MRESAGLCNFSMLQFRQFQERNIDRFSLAGSSAFEAAEFTARKYGPAAQWSEALIHRVSARSFLYLAATEQHIAGLQTLLVHRPYTLSLAPIVRSCIEGSARAIWLLDNRLSLKEGSRARVARLMLDEEDEARKSKYVMNEFGHPERAKAGDEYRHRRDMVAKPGWFYLSEIDINKAGEVTLCGEKLPGPSQTVRIAEAIMHPEGDRLMSGVYSYLSSIAHPSVLSFLDSVDEHPGASTDSTELRVRESPEFSAKLASMAVRAFHEAWRAYASWTGTSQEEQDAVGEKHNELHRLISTYEASEGHRRPLRRTRDDPPPFAPNLADAPPHPEEPR